MLSPQDVGYPEFLNIRPYMSQNSGDPVMYGLYAVLVHSGYSCHAGHYYCYVKVSPGGTCGVLRCVGRLLSGRISRSLEHDAMLQGVVVLLWAGPDPKLCS